jgi:hypothetical protein
MKTSAGDLNKALCDGLDINNENKLSYLTEITR